MTASPAAEWTPPEAIVAPVPVPLAVWERSITRRVLAAARIAVARAVMVLAARGDSAMLMDASSSDGVIPVGAHDP